jgi:thymidylate synthase (FAD)
LPEEYYLPDPGIVGSQSATNKQGREVEENPSELLIRREKQVNALSDLMVDAFSRYRALLDDGWPRELARSVLPVATYSHMFATVDLLNLFRFLTLRCDGDAQYEIRVYANAILKLIDPVVPVCVSAWRALNVDVL